MLKFSVTVNKLMSGCLYTHFTNIYTESNFQLLYIDQNYLQYISFGSLDLPVQRA
jgi:hypothetical protein